MNTTADIKAHIDGLTEQEVRDYIFLLLDQAVPLMIDLENYTDVHQYEAWIKLKSLVGAPETDWLAISNYSPEY